MTLAQTTLVSHGCFSARLLSSASFSGCLVKLFVGGAQVTSDAEAEVEKVSCTKLIFSEDCRFNVLEPGTLWNELN